MKGILLDTNTGDLLIKLVKNSSGMIVSGLVIGNIDYQRCSMIIKAKKGEIKEYPTLGFGVEQYKKSGIDRKQEFIGELTKELNSDGFKKAKVTVGSTLLNFTVDL